MTQPRSFLESRDARPQEVMSQSDSLTEVFEEHKEGEKKNVSLAGMMHMSPHDGSPDSSCK